MEVAYRKRHQDDNSFIYATWLRGQRNEGHNQFVGNKVYFANQTERVKALVERCQTIVACNPNSHDQVYGYLCFETFEGLPIIHYAHIKTPFRRLGFGIQMAKRACPKLGKEETIITFLNGFVAARTVKYKLVYNPFLVSVLETVRGKDGREAARAIAKAFGS